MVVKDCIFVLRRLLVDSKIRLLCDIYMPTLLHYYIILISYNLLYYTYILSSYFKFLFLITVCSSSLGLALDSLFYLRNVYRVYKNLHLTIFTNIIKTTCLINNFIAISR